MTTEQGNKLIAEFMGLYHKDNEWREPVSDRGHYTAHEELQYHSSWDWLMPVVEKIEGDGNDVSISSQMTTHNDDIELRWVHSVEIHEGGVHLRSTGTAYTKIKAVWDAVIDYIETAKPEFGGELKD